MSPAVPEVPYPFDDVLGGHPHHHPQSRFLLWATAADAIHGGQVCRSGKDYWFYRHPQAFLNIPVAIFAKYFP